MLECLLLSPTAWCQGEAQVITSQVNINVSLMSHVTVWWWGSGKNKVEWTRKGEFRKEEFLAAVQACKAIFWTTLGFSARKFQPARGRGHSPHSQILQVPTVQVPSNPSPLFSCLLPFGDIVFKMMRTVALQKKKKSSMFSTEIT